MRRMVVVYQSKYGATKKYAQWISQELACDLLEGSSVGADTLLQYDTIIYGGGVYAGKVSGIRLITKNIAQLKNKNIVVFTCGLADPNEENNLSHLQESVGKAFGGYMDKIKVFYLRGGMDYSKLSFMHSMMMKMLYKSMAKKEKSTLTAENQEFLSTYGKVVDFTSKKNVEPILQYLKEIKTQR